MQRPDAPRAGRAGGFTLVEVVIALVLGGMVLIGARAMLEVLADSEQRLAREAVVEDRAANADRVLRALVGRLEVGTRESGPFSGTPSAAHFTSWCETSAGWLERCSVTLSLERVSSGIALVARPGAAPPLVLRGAVRTGALLYLSDPGDGGHWFHAWGEGITAPVAIAVVLDGDTTIVRIGGRG